jgi:hypothetical protein
MLIYVILAVSAAATKSSTYDEPLHLTFGYYYWTHPELKNWPDVGVFAQAWAALPLLFEHLKVVQASTAPSRMTGEWERGYRFFYMMGNDTGSMLLQARAMISLLGVGVGLLVYQWSKRLFGATGGLISVFLFALDPTMLAHGALVTADMAATLWFFVATYCFWRLTEKLTWLNLLLSVTALGCLELSKMSAILIAPIMAAILLVRVFSQVPMEIGFGHKRTVRSYGGKVGAAALLVLIHAVAGIGVLWLAYRFNYFEMGGEAARQKILNSPDYSFWSSNGRWACTIDFLSRWGILPKSYLEGFSFQLNAMNRPSYLFGSYSDHGRWYFFPVAFLIKTPIGTLGLLLAALAACASWGRFAGKSNRHAAAAHPGPSLYDISPLLILGGVYGAACLTSNLNIGHRHMMPIYPVLFVLAGASSLWLQSSRGIIRAALAILLASVAVESLANWPHYIAFFNQLIGGPSNGYHYLVNSSLDWGQDLPGLRRWLDQNAPPGGGQKVYVSYFGAADPAYYGIKAVELPSSDESAYTFKGGIYCVSASGLEGVQWTRTHTIEYQALGRELGRWAATAADPKAREALIQETGENFWITIGKAYDVLKFYRLCLYLQRRKPDDEVGYSILIFRLTDSEIKVAIEAEPQPVQESE